MPRLASGSPNQHRIALFGHTAYASQADLHHRTGKRLGEDNIAPAAQYQMGLRLKVGIGQQRGEVSQLV